MPAPIKGKHNENDILFTLASEHERIYPNVHYHFIYTLPYSNFLLSLFSKKRKSYYELRKQKRYVFKNRTIHVIPVLAFSLDKYFRRFLTWLTYKLSEISINKIIDQQSIDIIHAQNVGKDANLAWIINKSKKVPYIVTTRNINNYFITNFSKKVLNTAFCLLSLNHIFYKLSKPYNTNCLIVPHGVADIFFKNRSTRNSSILKVLTVSRLLKLKNIEFVIRALSKVNFDYVYDIYGEGPEFENLRHLINSLKLEKKVKLHGSISSKSVHELYIKYDLFAMPSHPETFGRVYTESMACGTPVIAALGSGMDGFIDHDVNGFLVDPFNTEKLIELFNRVNSNSELLSLVSENSRKLSEKFRMSNVVDKIDCLYKSVK